jgi:hypothetical protein
MLLQPKLIKPDEKWDTTLSRGRGDLSFVEIQRFCGICPNTFETDCRIFQKLARFPKEAGNGGRSSSRPLRNSAVTASLFLTNDLQRQNINDGIYLLFV